MFQAFTNMSHRWSHSLRWNNARNLAKAKMDAVKPGWDWNRYGSTVTGMIHSLVRGNLVEYRAHAKTMLS